MYVERVWFARWLIWIALIYIFGAFDADGGSWRGHGYASWEWEWMAARAKRIIPRIRISDTSSACRVQGRDLGMRNGAPTSKLKWKLNRYTCVVVHSENRAQSRFAFNHYIHIWLALRLRSRCHSNPFFQFLRRCVCDNSSLLVAHIAKSTRFRLWLLLLVRHLHSESRWLSLYPKLISLLGLSMSTTSNWGNSFQSRMKCDVWKMEIQNENFASRDSGEKWVSSHIIQFRSTHATVSSFIESN